MKPLQWPFWHKCMGQSRAVTYTVITFDNNAIKRLIWTEVTDDDICPILSQQVSKAARLMPAPCCHHTKSLACLVACNHHSVRWMPASTWYQLPITLIQYIHMCYAVNQNLSGWQVVGCCWSLHIKHTDSFTAFGRQLHTL